MTEQSRSPGPGACDPLPVQVRPARAGDGDVIAGFNRAMARETEGRDLAPDTVRAGVAAVLSDAAHGFYLVAQSGDRPIGTLLVTFEWSDWRNGQFWWIQSVYVSPQARGRGVYRALHRYVLDRARERGDVCGLRLYVEKDNRAAQAVYRTTGMRDSGYRLYEQELLACVPCGEPAA